MTSISFHTDGCTIAVGSRSGKILIYDLRNCNAPKGSLIGHENKMLNSVEFSRKIFKSNLSNTSQISRNTDMSNSNAIVNSNNQNINVNNSTTINRNQLGNINSNINTIKDAQVGINTMNPDLNKKINILNELNNINLNLVKTSLTENLVSKDVKNYETLIKEKGSKLLNNPSTLSIHSNLNSSSNNNNINQNSNTQEKVNNYENASNTISHTTIQTSYLSKAKIPSQPLTAYSSNTNNINNSNLQNSHNNTGNFNNKTNLNSNEFNTQSINKEVRKPQSLIFNVDSNALNNSLNEMNNKKNDFTLYTSNGKTKINSQEINFKQKRSDNNPNIDNFDQETFENKMKDYIKNTIEFENVKLQQFIHDKISGFQFDLVRQLEIQNVN